MPESSITEVTLPTKAALKPNRSFTTSLEEDRSNVQQVKNSGSTDKKAVETNTSENKAADEIQDISQGIQPTYRTVDGKHNTYNREKLYKEVWEKPVIEVAVQNGVSDVTIHKICKSLDVPVPPRGYWAKLRAGGIIKKTPFPKTNGAIEIIGTRTFEGVKAKKRSSRNNPI